MHTQILSGMKDDIEAIWGMLSNEIEGSPRYKKAEKELVDIRESVAAVREYLESVD